MSKAKLKPSSFSVYKISKCRSLQSVSFNISDVTAWNKCCFNYFWVNSSVEWMWGWSVTASRSQAALIVLRKHQTCAANACLDIEIWLTLARLHNNRSQLIFSIQANPGSKNLLSLIRPSQWWGSTCSRDSSIGCHQWIFWILLQSWRK